MSGLAALATLGAGLAVVLSGVAPAAAAGITSWTAYVGNQFSNTVTPITGVNTASPSVGTSITTASGPFGVVISQDDSTLYASNGNKNTISVVATSTNTVTNTISGNGLSTPYGLAINPSATQLWVANYGANNVLVFCISSGGCGSTAYLGLLATIATGTGTTPIDVSIDPTGSFVYESNLGKSTVEEICDIARGCGATALYGVITTLTVGKNPDYTAFTPDGHYAYVANCGNSSCTGAGSVSLIANPSSTSPTVVSTISVAEKGTDVVELLPNCTPSSCIGYVTDYGSGVLSEITNADSSTPSITASAVTGFTQPNYVVVTPNSKYLYVGDDSTNDVYVVSTATNQIVDTLSGFDAPGYVAISPDPAPTASFTASLAPVGMASTFNGSKSSDSVAGITIVSYAWNFGDGCSETTTTPTVSFSFPATSGGACPSGASGTVSTAGTGPFSVSLTVTNSAGTSTNVVYTGHTVSNDGSTAAYDAQTLSLPSQLVASCSACSGAASATPDIGPVTLTLENASGTAMALPSGDSLSIDLSTNAVELSGNVNNFYAAPGGTCSSTPLSSSPTVTIPAGSSSVEYCYSDETASTSVTLTGAAASPAVGVASGTKAVTVTAAAPTQMVLTSNPVTATASATPDLGPIGITIEDQYHNPSPLPSGDSVTLSLSSSSTGTNEFSTYNGTCSSTAVPSVTIGGGADLAQVCYGDELAGSPTLSFGASTTGFTLTNPTLSAGVVITPGAPTDLRVTSPPVAGSVSSTPNLGPINLTITDAFGNPSPLPSGDSASISLSDGGKGGKFSAYFSGACSATTITAITVTAGTASAPVCYGNAAQGAYALSFFATPSGFSLSNATATQTETVLAATKVVITTSAFSQAASPATKSKVTATLENASGTPEAVPTGGSVTLSFSSSSAAGAFAASSGASPAPGTYSVTIGAGSSAASAYYADTVAGNPIITASVSGLTPGTQKETITPGPVDTTTSDAVASPTTQSADGIGAVTVTVTLADQYGNGISGKAVSLTQGSSTSATITAIDATTNADGLASFSVTDTTAQVVDLTAKDTTDSITISNTTPNPLDVTFVSGLPDVTGVSPSSGSTAGGNVVTITGTNFTGATGVDFGVTAATNFTVVSSTEITATAPAATSPGLVELSVVSSAGTSATTSLNGYIYVVSGAYTPVAPYRICDTRLGNPSGLSGLNAQCNGLTLQPGAGSSTKGILSVTVAGTNPSGTSSGGVPAGAVAVVMNVSVIGPAASSGNLGVWPAGTAMPTAAVVNWYAAGETIDDQVEVPLGAGGAIMVHNGSPGTVNLAFDVQGYVTSATTSAGMFVPVAEYRICDTRTGQPTNQCTALGAMAPRASYSLQATGLSSEGIPATGVAAVMLRLTVVGPTTGGNFSAYATGSAPAITAVVNWTPGVPPTENHAIVPVGACSASGCYVTVSNNSPGTVNLVADVLGYFTSSSGTGGSQFNPITPHRVCDTRPNNPSGLSGTEAQCTNGTSGSTLQAGLTTQDYTCTNTGATDCEVISVVGMGGIPTTGVKSVVMNVTTIAPTSPGTLFVTAPFSTLPVESQITYRGAHSVQNELLVVQPNASGQIELFNHSNGTVNVTVDLVGWYG